MRFNDVLKEAFTITWRNRWFWIAGFLILPQLVGGYPIDFNYKPGNEFPLSDFMMIMAVAMIAGFFIFLASIIIQPALILATTRARTGSAMKAAEALHEGFVYAGRCLILALLQMGCAMLLFLMLGVPIVIAFINSIILGVVVAFFFAPLAIAISVVLAIISGYAIRNIVLRNLGVGDSVVEGYRQFKATKLPSIGLLITAWLIPVVAITPLTFPVSMAKAAMTFTALNSTATTVAFFTIVTILSIPVVGYFGAFSSVLWTIAYQEWFGDGTAAPNAKF
ncbi:MAG: hypothetical protein WBP29_03350 [Candidatus Zixiibacteriota bacterium]